MATQRAPRIASPAPPQRSHRRHRAAARGGLRRSRPSCRRRQPPRSLLRRPRPAPPTRTSAPTSSSSTRACRSARSGRRSTRSTPSRSTTRWARAGTRCCSSPATYGTDAEPLQIKVGYYTEVAGLGASPADVVINGKIEVYNRCLENGGTSNCLALVNFWRTLSNLTIERQRRGPGRLPGVGELLGRVAGRVDAPGQRHRREPVADGLLHRRPAVRQRRLHRRLPAGTVINGSQQQWLTRDSEIGGWSNGVWNAVFAGVEGAPDRRRRSRTRRTRRSTTTPLSREKPYLFVDGAGRVQRPRPGRRRRTSAASPGTRGLTPGRTIPITDFFVARPADSVQDDQHAARARPAPAAHARASTTSRAASPSSAPTRSCSASATRR